MPLLRARAGRRTQPPATTPPAKSENKQVFLIQSFLEERGCFLPFTFLLNLASGGRRWDRAPQSLWLAASAGEEAQQPGRAEGAAGQ